jgi:hypothetical protein
MLLRTARRARRAGWLALVPLALAALPAAPAQADDPTFVGSTSALPPMPGGFTPSSSPDCTAGRVTCVHKLIREMERRFEPLAASCSHAAVFSLSYLRTTQTYLETVETPGFYSDPAFVNHEDAAFASLYFDAYDAWAAGRTSDVPPAWQVAFRAAEQKQVSGSGDLLLGISAHVNRDLPFVLASIGLVAPDGSSRKADHDRINVMLNKVQEPLLAEQAARFDPDMAVPATPYGLGYTGLMQTLMVWREAAWRSAERLVAAPDAAARARVAEDIEQQALAEALAIRAATSYLPPLRTTTARDQFCASRAGGGG